MTTRHDGVDRDVDVAGACADRFAKVREVFAENFDRFEAEVGACVAVSVDGEIVVDLWGGWADAERQRPWQQDTVCNTWSSTKTVTNLCAAVLVDRGELDVDAPVARYWPEFAAAGKQDVLIRQVLSHTAGLPGWDEQLMPEDLADWDRCTSLLAAQQPWWSPGTAAGYHALTQGYLVGELIRRVTSERPGTVIRELVTGPLDADFSLGWPAAAADRVAEMVPPAGGRPPLPADPENVAVRVIGNPSYEYTVPETSWWRAAEIPAANGFGNARAIVKVQSALACDGESDGVRLLSRQGCRRIFTEQYSGPDLVAGRPVRYGLGFGLVTPGGLSVAAAPGSCFWGGSGGSVVVVDPDARMAFAYVMNGMRPALVGDERSAALLAATYAALSAADS